MGGVPAIGPPITLSAEDKRPSIMLFPIGDDGRPSMPEGTRLRPIAYKSDRERNRAILDAVAKNAQQRNEQPAEEPAHNLKLHPHLNQLNQLSPLADYYVDYLGADDSSLTPRPLQLAGYTLGHFIPCLSKKLFGASFVMHRTMPMANVYYTTGKQIAGAHKTPSQHRLSG